MSSAKSLLPLFMGSSSKTSSAAPATLPEPQGKAMIRGHHAGRNTLDVWGRLSSWLHAEDFAGGFVQDRAGDRDGVVV